MAAHLTSAVTVDGGKVASFEGHEGRIAETWVKCREDMCGFAVYFLHSEGWTTRKEELMKAV